jgi:hypothetical protein
MDNSYIGAGCLFLKNNLFLAGVHKTDGLTGLGGKGLFGEKPIQTAWREVLEELFDWKEVDGFLLDLLAEFEPDSTITNNNYIQHIYSIDLLESVLEICKACSMESKLYKLFPTTITELLFKRIQTKKDGLEVQELSLLPLTPDLKISDDLLNDIKILSDKK